MKGGNQSRFSQLALIARSAINSKMDKAEQRRKLFRRSEKKCTSRLCFIIPIVLLVTLNLYGPETDSLLGVSPFNFAAHVSTGTTEMWSRTAGNFALWTYPIAPPSTLNLLDGDSMICAYNPCREYARARNITSYTLNIPQILQMATTLPATQATKFKRFLDDQHWFKLQLQLEFPHHVQSIAFLSLAAVKELSDGAKFCIRPLGHDSVSSCGKDGVQKGEYDPTSSDPVKNRPPFAVAGLNFNATRFGVLSYDGRAAHEKVANSGDELQGFSGLQFLPYLTDFVDRDFGLPATPAQHLFANAWWGFNSAFPPPSSLNAAWFSAHMSSKFQTIVVPQNIEYFRRYAAAVGPIGARDAPTLAFLKSLDLPTYQSSCFTQMLRPSGNTYKEKPDERDLIMLVDVDTKVLPPEIAARGVRFRANVNASRTYDRQGRLEYAQELYSLYSTKAKVVITSRIHSALPASVNGVPVIFVDRDESKLPGGKGGRTKGISDLFHTYFPDENPEWTFDLDHMLPNPGVHRQDRYRASFWHYIKHRLPQWYVDTATLFGLVPLRRLGEGVAGPSGDVHDLFHFIFTTPVETLTWRVQRAIEAVFYHHPNAKVILHSQSLPVKGTLLDVFVEAGYDFQIRPYDVEDLLSKSQAVPETEKHELLAALPERKYGKFWYSHETDLVRLLILEAHGGIYLDTDVHVIKPFPRSFRNVLAYQDRLTAKRALKLALVKKVNGAVMVFERSNSFLKEVIAEAVNRLLRHYNPDDWGILGPNLLSDTWRAHVKNNPQDVKVQILDNAAFYPYTFGNAKGCFTDNAAYSPITEATYAVHLNTKVTSMFQGTREGSYCDMMFHTFCIFCDDVVTARRTMRSRFFIG